MSYTTNFYEFDAIYFYSVIRNNIRFNLTL